VRMLHLSWMSIWSMGPNKGIPCLFEAMRYYTAKGYEIDLLIPDFKSTGSPIDDRGDLLGVTPHVVKVPGLDTFRMVQSWAGGGGGGALLSSVAFWLAGIGGNLCFTFAFVRYAVRLGRTRKVDIVYGHHEYVALATYIAGLLLRRPTVCHIYGSRLASWVDRGTRAIGLRAPIASMPFLLPFDLLITVDDGSRMDRIAAHFGTSISRFRMWADGLQEYVRPEGITKLQLAETYKATKGDCQWILSVCRLIIEKRVDRAIRAMPGVLRVLPSTQLIIVGDGSQKVLLERVAQECGVEPSVVFLGSLTHSQLQGLRSVSDVAVTLSDRSNKLLVLREALQCGLPVVTLADGTVEEIISDGVNGFCVPPDDDEALANALIRVLSAPNLRQHLSQGALETARSFWGWDERMQVEEQELSALCRSRIVPHNRGR
jgi:glycosyltransferase involved in cell wall biosynthesis